MVKSNYFTCSKLLSDIRDCALFFSANVRFLFLPLNSCFPIRRNKHVVVLTGVY